MWRFCPGSCRYMSGCRPRGWFLRPVGLGHRRCRWFCACCHQEQKGCELYKIGFKVRSIVGLIYSSQLHATFRDIRTFEQYQGRYLEIRDSLSSSCPLKKSALYFLEFDSLKPESLKPISGIIDLRKHFHCM